MKAVNELMCEKNKIEAEIASIEQNITDDNTVILVEEVMNLLDGVSTGFRKESYYAPNRLYSKINGVKNIRIEYDRIQDTYPQQYIASIRVKVTSPVGKNLPKSITVRGVEYPVRFWESSKYESEIDY